MRKKLMRRLAILALVMLIVPNTLASSVLLVPVTPVMGHVGDIVSLDIVIDFSDQENGAAGGSFDIIYDGEALGFVSVTAVDVCNGGCVYFIPPGPMFIDETGSYVGTSGLFNWAQLGLLEGGLAADGPYVVGNVEFEILPQLVPGSSAAIEIGYFDGFVDSWVAGDFVTIVEPTFNQILVTRVPLPAAAWLMLGALVSLFAAGRRRRTWREQIDVRG